MKYPKKAVTKTENFYRIRELFTGNLIGTRNSSMYTKKGTCEKEVDRLNKLRTKEDITKGINYVLATYELKEVTRQTKIKSIINDETTK